MDLDFTDASVKVHLGRRTAVEVQRDEISGVRVGPAPLISRLGTRWWWGATEAMDFDRRRAAAERALHTVYVNKATKLGNRFDVSRLDPVWR